jgi:hypothetical protein
MEQVKRYEDLSLEERKDYWNNYLIKLVEYNNDCTTFRLHDSQNSIEDEIFKIKKTLQILRQTPDERTISSALNDDRKSDTVHDAAAY